MSYLDDDPDEGGGEGISFSGFDKSSKKAKSADTTFDMVDVSPIFEIIGISLRNKIP